LEVNLFSIFYEGEEWRSRKKVTITLVKVVN